MKRITFTLAIFMMAFFAMLQNASAQWNGTNPLWTNGNVGIGTPSPYKLFTVNGDISLADYGDPRNGFNGLEILGNNQIPTRRGISLDNDPNGSLNFYVNSNQGPSAFNFKNGNGLATLMTINGVNGNVGIGTTTPNQLLDVKGNISVNDNAILLHFSNDNNHGLRYTGVGHPFANNIAIDGPAIYGFGGGVLGSKNFNASTEKIALLWDTDGNVAIGTANTAGYKLAVNGSIRAKSLRVEPGWSDFVFEKDYKLRTIEDTEYYIKTYGHLPDIPGACEVAENGIEVGEMNAKLLQKIEELTLYIIELNKEINQLKHKN